MRQYLTQIEQDYELLEDDLNKVKNELDEYKQFKIQVVLLKSKKETIKATAIVSFKDGHKVLELCQFYKVNGEWYYDEGNTPTKLKAKKISDSDLISRIRTHLNLEKVEITVKELM